MGDWIRSFLLGLLKRVMAKLDPSYAKELDDYKKLKQQKTGEMDTLNKEIEVLNQQTDQLSNQEAASKQKAQENQAAAAETKRQIKEVQDAKAHVDTTAMPDNVALRDKL